MPTRKHRRGGESRRRAAALRSDQASRIAKSQQPLDSSTRLKPGLVGVWLIFLVHSLGLALLFDPFVGLLNREPVIEQDWGLHFHHLKSLVGFWQEGGRLWGYSPFFMAGYPSNTIQDVSVKLFEILSLLLSFLGLDPIQAFKLLVFVATASVPWIMFLSARNFFDGESFVWVTASIAAFLGTAYWWNSFPREMFFYGMVGFPVSSYLSLLVLSLFYRVLKSEKTFNRAHAAWLMAVVLILPLHLQAVLILTPPALAMLISRPELFRPRALLWLGAGVIISLLVNLIWLIPLFRHLSDDVSSVIVSQLPLFLSSDPLTFLKDYLRPAGYWTFRDTVWEKGLRWVLLIVGLTGLFRLTRGERRDVGVMMACAVLSLFLLTYFGSFIPSFKSWQPLRFKVPYDVFLVLTSSYLAGSWHVSRREVRSTFVPILLIFGVAASLVNIIQTESKNNMRLRTRISPEVADIVDWIRNDTPKDGRVLFEESGDETGFVYDGMYLSSFIPHLTGRQLIGGPINLYNDRHHFAEFHSGILFKRDISEFTSDELRAYFKTYNIGAVVAFHPRSVDRLLSVPQLVRVDHRVGDVHLMKVNQPLSWFLKGEGSIQAGLNIIRGFNVSSQDVILKFHWAKGLVSNPAANIVPEKILDDPIPFIRIVHPPSEFTLQIDG